VRLAAWYNQAGDVRDHKEMFVVTLVLSDFPGHRDVGLAMLRELPPYQVVRVFDFIHGRKTTRKVRDKDGANERSMTESFGLFKNPPRSLRTEIERYLREREADPDWFDGIVLIARKYVKRLYALNHVKPGERAQRILFDEDPPRTAASSRCASSPRPPARRAGEGDHRQRDPVSRGGDGRHADDADGIAGAGERDEPQELINNVASLKKRGAFDNADIKALIEQKLEQAQSATRVSAFKASKALEVAGVSASADMKERLEKIADAQVKAKGRIQRPTALLIDKSGSMSAAIELGKRIGAMISTVCEQELFVYAFDTMAYPIERGGNDLASWERALVGITAGGGTACGAPLEAMRRKQQYVEQIILVTDEGDNTVPFFVPALQKYRQELKADPASASCARRVA
jgi:hypothetical protein